MQGKSGLSHLTAFPRLPSLKQVSLPLAQYHIIQETSGSVNLFLEKIFSDRKRMILE